MKATEDSKSKKIGQANPFPPTGQPDLFEVWADRRKVEERLKRYFDSAFASEQPRVIEISGTYGSGKSHTLKNFKHRMEEGWEGAKVLPLYMDTVGYDLLDFYNRFLSTVQFERIRKALRNLQAATVVAQSAELQKAYAEGKATERSVEDTLSKAKLFADMKSEILKIFNEMKPLRSGGSFSDFWGNLASALTFIIGDDENFAATKWITFGKVYKSELELLREYDRSFTTYTLSPAYIAYCMAGILSLIGKQDNYNKVVLFIDEMEAIKDGPDEAMPQLAECLRHLIDSGFPGLVIVMGFSTESSEVFKDKVALTERIHSKVKLDPLSPEDALEFAKDYIEASLGKHESQLFNLEVMKILNAEVQGKPRQLVELLSIAYDFAVAKDLKALNKETAQEAIRESRVRASGLRAQSLNFDLTV